MASQREEAGEESVEKVRKKMAGDVLTCSVCLERYRCPKLLPCFHTFCQRCVEKVAGTRPSFPCPTCRTVTVMPPGGAAHLQANFYLEKDLASQESETGRECELCSKGKKAKHKCVQCQQGWVKSVRRHKDNAFVHISDGSGPHPLQIVTSPETLPDKVTFASCVKVEGQLKESPAKGQPVELVADSITLLGHCDNTKFPFGARHKHTADYCRDFLHLRPKTDVFASLLRLRSTATAAFHSYFQKKGYLYVHTPILTSNDCEGGGEVFLSEPAHFSDVPSSDSQSGCSSEEERKHFFSHPAFLTVSGQLHLEAVASAVSKVYNFGPTFRAENSRGRHHLSEFYMVEAELAFLDSQDDLMQIMEEMVQDTCQYLLTSSEAELDFYLQRQGSQQHKDFIAKVSTAPFARLTYTEAVKMLEINNHNFLYKVKWGVDLKKEHEKFLTRQMGDVPVFVSNFPTILKPFYAKATQDGSTVAAVDLLVPGVGELIGGSLREDDYSILADRLHELGMEKQLRWYLELRQFGSSPHGGFGLGFERFLQFVLNTPNIKDTLPFPRWPRNCQL